MENNISLREWVQESKIWKLNNWKDFLEKNLIPFYQKAYNLEIFFKFLEELSGRTSIADIEDEILRKKVKVAIYGGINQGNHNKSFAKFMYDMFGLTVEKSSSFEESIKTYERFGENVKLSIN
ncbi:MAG: hypothetical protein GXO21_07810, partial [Aquificae bacterium]|nr:hypothetical protein [Aquificota bacterium]